MKRSIVLVVAVTTLVVAVAACTPTDVSTYDCLSSGRPIYDVPSNHSTPWPPSSLLLVDGTAIDARGEVWDDTDMSTGWGLGMKFHARVGSRDNLCLVGGTIRGQLDPENTPWTTWHKVYGLFVETDNFTVIGTSFFNQGDMISFSGARNWKVIGVRGEGPAGSPGAYMHDDCVENDLKATGLVDDSKFDGCNVFMSSNSSADGSGNTVEVRNSLVRLQPYRNNFDTAKYGENTNGGFFKWSNPAAANGGLPPQLIVRDTTFRADQQGSFGGNTNGFMGLPPDTVCDNVTLIGSEAWRAVELASWQSQCTNLSYGTVADWDARVAAWDATHPAP